MKHKLPAMRAGGAGVDVFSTELPGSGLCRGQARTGRSDPAAAACAGDGIRVNALCRLCANAADAGEPCGAVTALNAKTPLGRLAEAEIAETIVWLGSDRVLCDGPRSW